MSQWWRQVASAGAASRFLSLTDVLPITNHLLRVGALLLDVSYWSYVTTQDFGFYICTEKMSSLFHYILSKYPYMNQCPRVYLLTAPQTKRLRMQTRKSRILAHFKGSGSRSVDELTAS